MEVDRLVRVEDTLLEKVKALYPEWQGLEGKALVDVALRKLVETCRGRRQ